MLLSVMSEWFLMQGPGGDGARDCDLAGLPEVTERKMLLTHTACLA